jgi:hypothetical protein
MQRTYLKSIHLILLLALIFTISAPAVNPAVQASKLYASRPLQQESAAPVLLTTTPASGASWDGSPVMPSPSTKRWRRRSLP